MVTNCGDTCFTSQMTVMRRSLWSDSRCGVTLPVSRKVFPRLERVCGRTANDGIKGRAKRSLFTLLQAFELQTSLPHCSMMLTIAERVDIIAAYFESQRHVEEARLRYANLFPDRNVPSATTFRSIIHLFTETGSVHPKERVRPRPVTNENAEVNVLAAVAANPNISSRQIARGSGMSQRSVLRILHVHKFHPYHVSLHQELHGDDFQQRLNFCNWIQQQLAADDDFISHILFSDESTFTNHGQLNRHNMHYWSVENPHWLRQVEHQRPWSVNVWCGMLGTRIIGPYFIEGTLNGQMYGDFLENKLPILLEDVPLQTRMDMWFQHDGCPAHYSRISRDVLNRTYPGRWIGRGGPQHWPARSPDLTSPDFFLWGTLKERCYMEVPTTPENMRQRIINVCANIREETRREVGVSFRHRVAMCIAENGHHFEHLLR